MSYAHPKNAHLDTSRNGKSHVPYSNAHRRSTRLVGKACHVARHLLAKSQMPVIYSTGSVSNHSRGRRGYISGWRLVEAPRLTWVVDVRGRTACGSCRKLIGAPRRDGSASKNDRDLAVIDPKRKRAAPNNFDVLHSSVLPRSQLASVWKTESVGLACEETSETLRIGDDQPHDIADDVTLRKAPCNRWQRGWMRTFLTKKKKKKKNAISETGV